MREAIIIHGSPDKAEYFSPDTPTPPAFHWLPWLQKQFQLAGVLAQIPSMPAPYAPKYKEWEAMFKRIAPMDLECAVGHSSGGGFLVKYLQANRPRIKKLVLAAPWFDVEKRYGGEWAAEFDPRALDGIGETHALISDDDSQDQQESAKALLAAYPKIIEHRFKDKGHFVGMPVFPELWEACR
jgi:predicted alpha/beta hydrolase family esterase